MGCPFRLWCWPDFSHLFQMPFAPVWPPRDVVDRTSFSFQLMPRTRQLTLAISGLKTIQRLRAAGILVWPSVPPSSFTAALFCLWPWLMAIAENLRALLLTTKFPFRNSAKTLG